MFDSLFVRSDNERYIINSKLVFGFYFLLIL